MTQFQASLFWQMYFLLVLAGSALLQPFLPKWGFAPPGAGAGKKKKKGKKRHAQASIAHGVTPAALSEPPPDDLEAEIEFMPGDPHLVGLTITIDDDRQVAPLQKKKLQNCLIESLKYYYGDRTGYEVGLAIQEPPHLRRQGTAAERKEAGFPLQPAVRSKLILLVRHPSAPPLDPSINEKCVFKEVVKHATRNREVHYLMRDHEESRAAHPLLAAPEYEADNSQEAA